MQKILAEKEAEEFLEKRGFHVIERLYAKNLDEIVGISKRLNFPWAMKASSKSLVHKAKLGGVILNIKNQMEAQEAFDKLKILEGFEEALIQPMVHGEELIIGLKKTIEFGLVLMIGKGGSKVEEEKDVSFRVLPTTNKDMNEMLAEIKYFKALKEKKVNILAIKEVLKKTAELVKENPDITEMDINPLIVNSIEAIVIDARIVQQKD